MKKKGRGKVSDFSELPLFASKIDLHASPAVDNNVVCMQTWRAEKKILVDKPDFISAYINLANKIKW